MGYGIGADLVAAFSHRRSESTKLVDRELVPRFQAAHGHAAQPARTGRLAGTSHVAYTVNKNGVTDGDTARRGWQAPARIRTVAP